MFNFFNDDASGPITDKTGLVEENNLSITLWIERIEIFSIFFITSLVLTNLPKLTKEIVPLSSLKSGKSLLKQNKIKLPEFPGKQIPPQRIEKLNFSSIVKKCQQPIKSPI